MVRKKRQLCALLLSAVVLAAQLPAVAMAENDRPADGSIVSFAPLDSSVAEQIVDMGTELSMLGLPDKVTATVYYDAGNGGESVPAGSAGDASGNSIGKEVPTGVTATEEISVTWGGGEPPYDGGTPGRYVFTAHADGYELSGGAKPPEIIVTVTEDAVKKPEGIPTEGPLACRISGGGCSLPDGHEGECISDPLADGGSVRTITGWTFADGENVSEGRLALPGVGRDSQADFDAVVSMLPTQLNAEIEGETGTSVVPITGWSCPDYSKDENGSWPQGGAYTFTAKLPEGFACDPLPAVTVMLGGAQAYSMLVTGDGYSFDPGTGILTISNNNGSTAWKSGGIDKVAVKEVEVQEGVTSIGRTAFWNCTSLTEVTLPASLTSIGNEAFSDCTSLKKAVFLGASTTLGTRTFQRCSSLTEVILPDRLTFLPENTFWKCTGLEKITLPAELTSIGGEAFMECSSLTEVNLPVALTSISGRVFEGCSSLTEIALPDELQSIGLRAFKGTGLTTITIPPKVNSVGKWAFLNATNLKTVVFSGMDAPIFGDEIFGGITPPPTVYVPEGAIGYDSLSPVFMIFPVITSQPQNVTAEAGSPATFTAAADGRPSPSLQWQVDQGSGWNAVTDGIGGDTAAYTIPAVSAGMNGWKYRCVITNYAGTVITDEVTLTVKVPADSVTPDEGGTPSDGEQSSSGDKSSGSSSSSGDKSSGSSSSSGGSRTPVYGPQSNYAVTGDRISITLPRADIQSLADSGKALELSCDTAGMTFSASALRAVLAAAPVSGSITFAAAPADLSAFPDVAAFFGSRPVYDFTISGQDRNGAMARIDVNFPAGAAAISLDYTPSLLEVPGSLFMVYVDGMAWLDKSIYRADGAAGGTVSGSSGGRVLAEVPHFSTYGVAYKTPAPVFTDIAGHWAQEDIEFAAARGMLPGKGDGRFSPDAAMTHGMFAATLGRLAGVSPDRYMWGGFGDDAPVTREQMAVMMANFAVQMGYAAPLAAVPFADSGAVSSSAADRFDPQAYATRAEGAVVLRRFVEAVIDPETIGRWGKDDAGQWPGN